MSFVQRLVTSVDCEAAVWCGRYGEQQTLDALLHSGRTEACLVTALADQPSECYHNQVVTVYQCNHQGLQYCHRDRSSNALDTAQHCKAPWGRFQHVCAHWDVSIDIDAKIPDWADRWHRVIANYQRDCWQLMLATARRAPENLRLGGVQLQTVRRHPVADRRNALRHTALKFVCSSWLTEPVYLGIIQRCGLRS